MRNIKTLVFVKLLLLVWAMILAWCLIFINKLSAPVEQSTIIILDVSSGMMTQDIPTGKWDLITRLDAAKKIVQKTIAEFPQRSFWLITYWSQIDYLIPSTTDSGTLLQYTNSLLTQSGNVSERSTWLIAALQGKNSIVLWNISLPKSLLKNAQIVPLVSYKTFQPSNLSTSQHLNVSTVQTQWLIIILCLLTILSI